MEPMTSPSDTAADAQPPSPMPDAPPPAPAVDAPPPPAPAVDAPPPALAVDAQKPVVPKIGSIVSYTWVDPRDETVEVTQWGIVAADVTEPGEDPTVLISWIAAPVATMAVVELEVHE